MFDPADGLEHWAYVGRAGGDMELALDAMFRALAMARRSDPARYDRLRLHFVGTSYAEGDRAVKTVEPVAIRNGVGDLVDERPHRIPYFEALQVLLDADALVVPGSDDPSYTASKLYPYILARRPLLAVFHASSSVVGVVQQARAGVVVPFGSEDSAEAIAGRLGQAWFDHPLPETQTDWEAFAPYTARALAHRQAHVFELAGLDRFNVHSLVENPERADLILFAETAWGNELQWRARRHPLVKRYREKTFVHSELDSAVPYLPGVYTSVPKRWHRSDRVRTGSYLVMYSNPAISLAPTVPT